MPPLVPIRNAEYLLSQDLHFLVALWTAVPVRFLLIVAQYYLLFRQ